MTLVFDLKSGFFRRFTLKIVLFVAGLLSRYHFVRGKLFGINSIHFARFSLIDEGKRMLFLSDYDGSWDLYLDDFLTVGATAVVPIWTNLKGCPTTCFLFWPKPGFGTIFRPFIRHHQTPNQVWYSAYDTLSVANILRFGHIRNGLFDELDWQEEQEWLQQL